MSSQVSDLKNLAKPKNKQNSNIKASLQRLSLIDYEDESLINYRKSLISQEELFDQNKLPEIVVINMKIYDNGKLISTFQINQNIKLKLIQNTLYTVEIQFYVKKGIIYGLAINNSIYKSIIRLSKQQYRQGTFAPAKYLQTATFQIKTPGGILGRGSYTGQSSIKDKNQKIYKQVKYSVQICEKL